MGLHKTIFIFLGNYDVHPKPGFQVYQELDLLIDDQQNFSVVLTCGDFSADWYTYCGDCSFRDLINWNVSLLFKLMMF